MAGCHEVGEVVIGTLQQIDDNLPECGRER